MLDIFSYKGWTPLGNVNNYIQLVWAERFTEPGDFTLSLTRPNPDLKVGSYVRLEGQETIMKVLKRTSKTNNKGVIEYEYSGKTLDFIFDHRYATPEWLAVPSQDYAYPDGWEFGDIHEEYPFLKPTDVLLEILRGSNHNPELPFTFKELNGWRNNQELMTYFSAAIEQTVNVPLRELLSKANAGINFTLDTNGENIDATIYHIGWHKDVLFSYDRGDYIAYSNSYDMEMHPTRAFLPYEDGVLTTVAGSSLEIDMDDPLNHLAITSSIDHGLDKSEHDLSVQWYKGALYDTVNDRMQAESYDYDSTTRFSSSQITYGWNNSQKYYLGDVMAADQAPDDWPWVQVVEYIRTFDRSGAREYPSMKPFLGFYHPWVNGTEINENETHPMYAELYRNMKDNPNWV